MDVPFVLAPEVVTRLDADVKGAVTATLVVTSVGGSQPAAVTPAPTVTSSPTRLPRARRRSRMCREVGAQVIRDNKERGDRR